MTRLAPFNDPDTSTLPIVTLAWAESSSRLHTTTPEQADAWRSHGLDVVQVTDPDQISAAQNDPRVVWV